MLQAHSLLWHYLWVAPYFLLAALASLMWRRGLHREFPAFFCYAVFEAIGGVAIYAIDVSPAVSPTIYWWSYLFFLVVEVFIKLVVVGELLTHLLIRYASLGKLAKVLISSVGIILVFTATIIAAYTDPTSYWLISATRILGRSVNVVLCGLIVFIFVFAAHFHLRWLRPVFGITLGFGIVSSFSLAYWALMTVWLFKEKSVLLDFLNMATYHVCVLIWCYYLLVPQKSVTTSAAPLPDHNLDIWNRELERLLQQ
jgi:hypothetical protein